MKGKIDKDGYLWKEVPGRGMIRAGCINWACSNGAAWATCRHGCVAFEGPNTMSRCKSPFCTINDPDINCRQCEHWGDVYEIKICQGRQLFFDEFEDERGKP